MFGETCDQTPCFRAVGCAGGSRTSWPGSTVEEEGQLCSGLSFGWDGHPEVFHPFLPAVPQGKKTAPMHPVGKNKRAKESPHLYPRARQRMLRCLSGCVQQQCSAVQLTWDSFGRCRCESPHIYLCGTPCTKPTNDTHCVDGLYFGLAGATQPRVHPGKNHSTVKVVSLSLETVMASQVVQESLLPYPYFFRNVKYLGLKAII